MSTAEFVQVDMTLVKQVMDQSLVENGHSVTRADQEVPDDGALRAAVVKVMQGYVVNSKGTQELANNSITKDELYAEVFPNGASIPDTPEGIKAQEKLATKVWGLTNTGTSGHVQKTIDGTGMVLCEAKVPRMVSRASGKSGITSMQMGRFLTADHSVILTHYTGPAGAVFVGAGRTLDNKLGMVVKRQPELAATIARQMAAAVKQAIAAIPHADPKQMAALVAGQITDEAESA